ncbi:MAG: histidine kinase, partial [Erysipelothrix sp.]|nr:histidine kinase [Erysipelothrix sp.]
MKKANGLKKSFSTTIIIWMVVLSTLPLLGFSAFAFITYDRIMYQNFMQRTEDVVEGTRNLISNELQVFEDQLYEMSLDDNIIRMLKSDTLTPDDARYLNQIMHTVLGQKSNMVYIRLIQIEGDFQYSNYTIPSLYNINAYRHWGIYRHVQQDGYDAVYLNHYKHPNGRSNAMSVIRTIEDQGAPLGYLVFDVSKEYIQQIITSQPRPSIGTVRYIITSKQGHVVYNDSQYLGDNAFMGLSLQQSKITVDNESMYAENFIFESLDSRFDIYFYGIVFKDVFTDNTGLFRPVLIMIVIILALISGVMGYILSKRVVKPIVALSDTMKTIRSGDVTLDLPTKREDEIDEIRYQFMNMMQRIQGYHLQDLEKQDLLRRTEIKSLQSQINPHFLYNTLDSIKWMAKLEKVDAIPEIVTELGELLQRGMNVEETIVSVSEEV